MPAIGSFLQRSRHGTVYYFRRRIPDDLREVFGRHQLYRSLRTACMSTALVRARALATQTDRLFAQLRAMPPKKGRNDEFRTYLIFEADFDLESGLPTNVKLTTDPANPADQVAGERILKAALSGARGGVPPGVDVGCQSAVASILKPAKTLGKAIEEILRHAANMKGSTRAAYKTALQLRAIPFFGADLPLSDITQQKFAEYAKHPNALSKAYATKELYLVALCSMGEWQRNRSDNVPT